MRETEEMQGVGAIRSLAASVEDVCAPGQSARLQRPGGQRGSRRAESHQEDKIPSGADHRQQGEADYGMPDSEEEEEVRDGRDKNSQDTSNSTFFQLTSQPKN